MASPISDQFVEELQKQDFDEFFGNINDCVKDTTQSKEEVRENLFWPLGSHLFCSEEGAICLDNAMSVVKMMHLMLETVSPASSFEDHLNCFEDHLKYRYYTTLCSLQLLKRININSLCQATKLMALQSSGIDPQNDNISKPAIDCLQMAWHQGRAPNLNNAYVAFKLSKIMPRMAQLERSKERCDKSEDQLGYYETFKKFAVSRRESMVDLILFILPAFWEDVIHMVEQNELHTISAAIPIGLMCAISMGPR